jgi:hypothetical protein
LPKALDWAGIREQNTMGLGPPIVKMDPIFWCSELYSAGHQSIPLAVEWSTWAPHDMLVAVCHDGTVAVWKVFPALSPLQGIKQSIKGKFVTACSWFTFICCKGYDSSIMMALRTASIVHTNIFVPWGLQFLHC